MTLLDDLPVGVKVGLDTLVFIYYVEGHPTYGPLVAPLFVDRLDRGLNDGVTSVVSVSEVLVQPLRQGRHDIAAIH